MRFINTPLVCLQIVDRVLIVQWHENEYRNESCVNQYIDTSYKECEKLVSSHEIKSAIIDLSTMSTVFMVAHLPQFVSNVTKNDTFTKLIPEVTIIGMGAFRFMPLSSKVNFCDNINVACERLKLDMDLIL